MGMTRSIISAHWLTAQGWEKDQCFDDGGGASRLDNGDMEGNCTMRYKLVVLRQNSSVQIIEGSDQLNCIAAEK